MKWRLRATKIKENYIIDLPDGAVPFRVDMPQSFTKSDGKVLTQFDGMIYYLEKVKVKKDG